MITIFKPFQVFTTSDEGQNCDLFCILNQNLIFSIFNNTYMVFETNQLFTIELEGYPNLRKSANKLFIFKILLS